MRGRAKHGIPRKTEKGERDAEELPTVAIDYMMMMTQAEHDQSEEGIRDMPRLAIVDTLTGRAGSHVVVNRGGARLRNKVPNE